MKNKFGLMILSIVMLGAQAYAGGSSTVGPGNPAAYNCIKLGGFLESFTSPQGEDSNCVIDEWKLFNEMYQRGLVKPHHHDNVGMPNPAAVNCIDINGTLRYESTPEGQIGFCVVEQWDLFRAIDITREN